MKAKFLKLYGIEAFRYLFFGGLTTLIYFIVKLISFNWLQSGWGSEVIAQVISISFAFIANKLWVFKADVDNLLHAFIGFVSSRLIFAAISILVTWIFIDWHPEWLLHALRTSNRDLASAVLAVVLQIVIIVANYLVSKFWIFKTNS
jgi:putative flippase GtrA